MVRDGEMEEERMTKEERAMHMRRVVNEGKGSECGIRCGIESLAATSFYECYVTCSIFHGKMAKPAVNLPLRWNDLAMRLEVGCGVTWDIVKVCCDMVAIT